MNLPAPVVFDTDVPSNPALAPIQICHLGLWCNSPKEAQAAGCLGTMPPLNGQHNAGVQAPSTRNFANDQGLLRKRRP